MCWLFTCTSSTFFKKIFLLYLVIFPELLVHLLQFKINLPARSLSQTYCLLRETFCSPIGTCGIAIPSHVLSLCWVGYMCHSSSLITPQPGPAKTAVPRWPSVHTSCEWPTFTSEKSNLSMDVFKEQKHILYYPLCTCLRLDCVHAHMKTGKHLAMHKVTTQGYIQPIPLQFHSSTGHETLQIHNTTNVQKIHRLLYVLHILTI